MKMKSGLHSCGKNEAFSLVEVVVAMGIFTFCFLTLIALLPIGLTSNKSSHDRMIVADLCGSIESDLKGTATATNASPINGIKFPAASANSSVSLTNTLYDTYTTSGTTTFSTTVTSSSQYRFTIVLTAPPTGTNPNDPFVANILATWPAQAIPSTNNGVNVSIAINRFGS